MIPKALTDSYWTARAVFFIIKIYLVFYIIFYNNLYNKNEVTDKTHDTP